MDFSVDLLGGIAHLGALCEAARAVGGDVWLVGGCVRDFYLRRAPQDIDVAARDPERLAIEFATAVGGKVVPMDPDFGIWRAVIPGGDYIDCCRFRDTDIWGDLRGRDFTFNAIALPVCADEGAPFDPFDGRADLAEGVIRMVSPSAFSDDPLRILRAYRFLSELGFRIDDASRATMLHSLPRLPEVAAERILAEWWRICGGKYASRALELMAEDGVLEALFPEMAPMRGMRQGEYHHLDVLGHSLLAARGIADMPAEDVEDEFARVRGDDRRRARLVFAALVHDIGKPNTRTENDSEVHFFDHDIEGAEIARGIAARLRMSREDGEALTTMIRLHMRPLFLLNEQRRGNFSRRTIIRFLDDAGEYLPDILLLSMADLAASRGPVSEEDRVEQLRGLAHALLEFYRNTYLASLLSPLLTGKEIMERLGIPPSPRVGEILREVRSLQLEGKLSSHDEALAWLRRADG